MRRVCVWYIISKIDYNLEVVDQGEKQTTLYLVEAQIEVEHG